jgi:MvdD pre-ATP grasp domain
MILILSNHQDVHAKHITNQLRQQGRDVTCLSRADFGNGTAITFCPDPARGAIGLRDGTRIHSDDVSAVWYRRPGVVRAAADIPDQLDRTFAENEWTSVLDAFFTSAFRRNVSPPLKQRAATKPLQLSIGARVGLRVPDTLITSDSTEAVAFVEKHHGAIVHKAITAPPHQFIDTRAWEPAASQHLGELELCPTIFQERIVGPADIRVTVVDRQLFAACIHTARGRAEVDSRLDADAPCTVYDLPRDVEARLLALMDGLGLVFGTIDLKVDESGDHVFLEVNPQGQFLYVEILTGLPISAALVQFLAEE